MQSCVINSALTEVPLLEQTHETVVSGAVQMPVPAASLSVAHAITPHIALYSKATLDVESHGSYQQSVGYYSLWNPRTGCGIYAGYGQGIAAESFIQSPKDSGRFHMVTSEFHLGFRAKQSERIRYGFSLKNGITWSELERRYTFDNPSKPDSIVVSNGKALIFAPGGFLQFGAAPCRFTIYAQMYGVYNLSIPSGFSVPPFSVGISMQYRNKPSYSKPRQFVFTNESYKEPAFFTHEVEYRWMYSMGLGIGLTHSFVYSGKYMTEHSHTSITNTPVFSVAADYSIRPWYSFGVQAGYMQSQGSLYSVPYTVQSNQAFTDIHFLYKEYYVGLRPLFHIVHFENLLLYTGLHFGVQYNTLLLSELPSAITEINITNTPIGYVPYLQYIPFGVRWFIRPHIGVCSEIGILKPYVLQGGIVIRM